MIKILKFILIIFFLKISVGLAIENKIILKIDNQIITSFDILDEIKNLNFFNKNLSKLTNDEIYQLAIQSITKYKIKKIEISENFGDVKFQNEDYLNELVEKTYKDLNFKNLRDFKDEMKRNQINYEKFKEKLEIEIFWNQIIYSKYYDKLIIDEESLKKKINSSNKTIKSMSLREIIYDATNLQEVKTRYSLIEKDIKELGFENAAIKHSISNTSKKGGNLGWIDESTISNEILNELNKISINSITGPIRIASGFLILQKLDKREIKKKFNAEEELKKMIDYEKNQQLNNYSNLYFNKIKKKVKINAP